MRRGVDFTAAADEKFEKPLCEKLAKEALAKLERSSFELAIEAEKPSQLLYSDPIPPGWSDGFKFRTGLSVRVGDRTVKIRWPPATQAQGLAASPRDGVSEESTSAGGCRPLGAVT